MVLLTHEVRLLEHTAERFAQQWRLLDLLRSLHTRYADASGHVTLVYETEIFLTSKI